MPFPAAQVIDAVVASRVGSLPKDEAAFADFYARTSAPLGRYLRRLTGQAALAEDLIQEAYLRFPSQARVPDDGEHRKN
jgi:DNA-directed RNA polymerase specialized sigma24 family protein